MKQDVKLSLGREDLPELGHREKTPSSFPLKIEYLMLSLIELGAKAFIVTTEVPVKMSRKIFLEKENSRGKQGQIQGTYYLPPTFSYGLSFSDYLLTPFNKLISC